MSQDLGTPLYLQDIRINFDKYYADIKNFIFEPEAVSLYFVHATFSLKHGYITAAVGIIKLNLIYFKDDGTYCLEMNIKIIMNFLQPPCFLRRYVN